MIQQPLLQTEDTTKNIAFYLFINTISGGRIGLQYLSIQAQSITFNLKEGSITVYFYDLLDQTARKKGITKIQQNINIYDNRVIICGGDGTVLWVIQEIAAAKINFDDIKFGVIPIGTGNDFARSLGWGSKPTIFSENNLSGLKKQILHWLASQIKQYDIWDFDLQFYENGRMVSVQKQRQVSKSLSSFNRSFSNYFGLGIDARVGFSFQKRRTKNAVTNLICYGCIGLFKWCRSINAIQDMIQTMQTETEEAYDITMQQKDSSKSQNTQEAGDQNGDDKKAENIIQQNSEAEVSAQQKKSNIKKQLVFHTDSNYHGSRLQLKKGFKNLLGLNSRSYMAGATKVWSSKKQGVIGSDTQQKFHANDFGDGQLQFCSFESELQLGLQRYVSGRASKVTQGPGPYLINFKKSQNNPIEVYFQIDGQFFKIYDPKSIKISKTKLIERSKINVMVKRL